MRLKKATGKIHLWLGLASGLIVVLLGVTGCMLAFEQEIRNLTEPYRFVKYEPLQQPMLPSALKQIAERELDGKAANSIDYNKAGEAVIVSYYDADNYKIVALNPYSGEVLKVKNMKRDFFRVVLDGHYYLWLPPSIGQPIMASATLIFLIMMITGLVLWWPRNKAARKQRFSVKFSTKWKRTNYDLHNVLGFYMTWVAIFLAISGLVMGFEWFAKSVYWVSSAGKAMPAYYSPSSDTLLSANDKSSTMNVVWQQMMQKKKSNESLSIFFAAGPAEVLSINLNHRPGTYYNIDSYYFDQYTGKELEGKGTYAGAFKKASTADKIKRMNYDIHIGAILGLSGKIMAFFGSLIAASLPVTGFYIWWGRRRKEKNTGHTAAKNLSANKLGVL